MVEPSAIASAQSGFRSLLEVPPEASYLQRGQAVRALRGEIEPKKGSEWQPVNQLAGSGSTDRPAPPVHLVNS